MSDEKFGIGASSGGKLHLVRIKNNSPEKGIDISEYGMGDERIQAVCGSFVNGVFTDCPESHLEDLKRYIERCKRCLKFGRKNDIDWFIQNSDEAREND